MSKRRLAVLALAAAAAGLAGCGQKIEAPFDRGVCWHVVPLTGGKVRFNKVAENRQSLEACAASLEGVRERFLGLGGSQQDLIGAYQGNFLFLGSTGVFTSKTLDGGRYPALVRTDDGRLAIPSAVQQ